jgi:hypothetical protein
MLPKLTLRSTPTLTLAFACALAIARSGFTQKQPLEIHLTLSKTAIMLGEPVWVDVSITNRSTQTLDIDWSSGSICGGGNDITVEIPDATPDPGKPSPCGMVSIECLGSFPSPLGPGQEETHHYLLAGNFRIVHPGTYSVVVTKTVPYFPSSKESRSTKPTDPIQTATLKTTLAVTAADPGKLLEIEQALGAKAEAMNSFHDFDLQRSIYDGLAQYPVAGMETTFANWAATDLFIAREGVNALSRLNTRDAHSALARLAEWKAPMPHPKWQLSLDDIYGIRRSAVLSLDELGNKNDLPLLENLATEAPHHGPLPEGVDLTFLDDADGDNDNGVRWASVRALAHIGGESELPFLISLAKDGPKAADRRAAIWSMGETGSAKAIPVLLSLFNTVRPEECYAVNQALHTLTHYQLPDVKPERKPQESQRLWEDWWAQNGSTARIYSSTECDPNHFF